MIYKQFKDIKLSALGMGCMRLPTIDNDNSKIDTVKTAQMTEYAINNGINYFDTAWGYHDGNSETIMGEILKQYPREKFYLASKFPGYDASSFGNAKKIFEKQLEKCQVNYFDFYLFHNVCELNIDGYLNDEKYGDFTYLLKQKENGRIKHLGFSTHGSLETVTRFLDVYGKYMEFCQIQLNYMDWEFQNAKALVELLNNRNIPIWVMEPLRGGKLATLNEFLSKKLKNARPDETIPAWAFRFLQTIPTVTVTLSGMSNFEQLKDNIETFSHNRPLNDSEWDLALSVGKAFIEKTSLPCTSCRYCTTHCPKGLNIPWLIDLYNEHCFTDGGFMAPFALKASKKNQHPSNCIGCRACEAVCPQNIEISKMMRDFVSKL